MSGPAIDVLVAIVAVAILVFFMVVQPQLKQARLNASLGALAPVIDGAVSKGHLHGGYGGYSVEAWPFKAGIGRATGSSAWSVPGDTFTIRLGGVQGSQPWEVRTPPSLNPFGRPRLALTVGLPPNTPFRDRVQALTGLPEADPAVEERLRGSGLMDEIARIQERSEYLRFRFMSSAEPALERRMGLLPGFAGVSAGLAEKMRAASQLECELQVPGGLGPTPDRFQELLDAVVRIARLNERANPAPRPDGDPAPAPARPGDPARLAQAIVGSWSNDLMTFTFSPDGTVEAGRTGGRQKSGTWSVAPDGRVHIGPMNADAEAHVEGDELTIYLQGMGWKLRRAFA